MYQLYVRFWYDPMYLHDTNVLFRFLPHTTQVTWIESDQPFDEDFLM